MQERPTTRSIKFLAALVVASGAVAAGAQAEPGALSTLTGPMAITDSVGTLQVNGSVKNTFNPVQCPVGNPVTTSCYHEAGGGFIPGLGNVSTAYTLLFDDFGSACGHVHAQIPILVTGKGEIDLVTRTTGCITAEQLTVFPPSEVTVSGGSGLYAGASGGGVLKYENHEVGGGSGSNVLTWTGTLNVPGLSFDTTPPQITGATSKVVKTWLAAGTRVRYSVSAADSTDGPVRAACLPKSGSLFRVGRTTVTCTAVDSSANTATARFVITVKRVRR